MRLFMDARYIRTDYHDGISRFSTSLIHAVHALEPVTVIIHDKAQLELLPAGIAHVKINPPVAVTEPLAGITLNKYHPDVVFSPMQTIGSAGRKYGLILTLHDLIYYQHRTPPKNLPQFVRGLWYLYHASFSPQRLLLNGADAVATVSNTTKRLMQQHRLTKRPIHVISNAPQPVAAPRNPSQEPNKSLVYMGSFMEYKNVELLIRALTHLPDYTLELCSKINAEQRANYLRLAQELQVGTNQLVFHNGVSDEQYARLLRQATALVTMSKSEGYGLPVAEALSHGTPVVLSNIEIFHEIGGGAARFVDHIATDAPAQLATHIRELEAPEVFRQTSGAAVKQAANYNWEDSARTLLDLAQRVHHFRQFI